MYHQYNRRCSRVLLWCLGCSRWNCSCSNGLSDSRGRWGSWSWSDHREHRCRFWKSSPHAWKSRCCLTWLSARKVSYDSRINQSTGKTRECNTIICLKQKQMFGRNKPARLRGCANISNFWPVISSIDGTGFIYGYFCSQPRREAGGPCQKHWLWPLIDCHEQCFLENTMLIISFMAPDLFITSIDIQGPMYGVLRSP